MQRDPKPPQETKGGLGKCPASPGLGTLGSYQDRGWAPALWCGHWGGCLGPSAPPATHSPPQELGPASLTYFRPARDKGGLSSSAQAEKGWEVAVGGHGQPVGPLHPWPYSLGNPQGLDTGETLECLQTLSLLCGSHLTLHLGQRTPREGAAEDRL